MVFYKMSAVTSFRFCFDKPAKSFTTCLVKGNVHEIAHKK